MLECEISEIKSNYSVIESDISVIESNNSVIESNNSVKESKNSDNIMKYLFDKDYENKICVECKSSMPSFVSINNSIIICGICAEKHRELGFNISYIRGIKDEWDPYLLSYLERGGNSRFIRLSKKYELDDLPIEQKFNTKILEYYRLLVRKII